jgi:uncharacterized protein YjbI with pentapeptide repeats
MPISTHKVRHLLKLFHARELSKLTGAKKLTTQKDLMTVPVEEIPLDVEILVGTKLRQADGTKAAEFNPLPMKEEETPENRDMNMPQLEKALVAYTDNPEVFHSHFGGRRGAEPEITSDLGGVLEGRDMSQLVLDGANISASFRRADLKFASFGGCRLIGCCFDNCDIRCASFEGAEMERCTFVGAQLEGALLSGAKIMNTSFRRSNMKYVTAYKSLFLRCDFSMADLSLMEVNSETCFSDATGWRYCRRVGWKLPPFEIQPKVNLLPGVLPGALEGLPPAQSLAESLHPGDESVKILTEGAVQIEAQPQSSAAQGDGPKATSTAE